MTTVLGIDYGAGDDQTVIALRNGARMDVLYGFRRPEPADVVKITMFGDSSTLFGVRFRESMLAVRKMSARIHKRRHWDRFGSYHRRVQKKWDKRFGMVDQPTAFKIDARVLGGAGELLIIHPSLMAQLRDRLREGALTFPTSGELR